VVFSYLQNKEAIKELFGEVAQKVGDRPGGYVRVIKLGFRRGDGAETAMIELVDFNETYAPNAGKVRVAKKTRRGGAKKAAAPAEAAIEAPTVAAAEEVEVAAMAEAPVVEEVVEQVEAVAEVVVEEAATEAPAEETPAAEDKKDEAQA
jgi:large subunit ribosomal protein L17